MKKYAKLFLLFLLVSTVKLYCQGEAAIPFVTLQQSPMLLGAGQIGAAIPDDDAIGFYYNPAILGYSSRNNHASIYFMPSKTDWFFSSQNKFKNYGFNLGYNLKSTKLDLPISVGLGYIHNRFDYGKEQIMTTQNPEGISEYESYDLFNCFSLGVGIDYFLKLNLGISLKSYESQLGGRIINGSVVEMSA
ncbi:MAG: hypothetical protein KDC52_04105, partial [Ignavibacteriae bacterium]|nr:hypothetical protein [Ignavibacteriota bacterium]